MRFLDDVDLKGKRVLMRVDCNVPLDKNRQVTDDNRIQAVLPSLRKLLEEQCRVVLASHLGRPKGKVVAEMSLRPVADSLSRLIGQPITLAPDCIGPEVTRLAEALQPGQVLLLENLRFHPEEEQNDPGFSQALAAFCNIYVNEGFAVSHRAHASVHGITRYARVCVGGYQLQQEISYFHKAFDHPQRPVAVVIGGAKVSSKIGVLTNILPKTEHLFIGGAMANTFLKAQGLAVGASLVEDDYLDTARDLLDQAAKGGVALHLPVDVVVAAGLEDGANAREVSVDQIPPGMQALDVGPKTVEQYTTALKTCRTIVWNGPLGVFETPPFHQATFALAQFLGSAQALTVIGGGDSAAAVKKAGVADKVSYVSTGGGAFLEMMEGKILPGIAALEECAQKGGGTTP
jgi:phosphoglycerate kinase